MAYSFPSPQVAATWARPTGEPDYLALLEAALVLRQEAVLAVERLLAEPSSPAALAAARRRVECVAADSAAVLHRFEMVTELRRAGAPLR